MDTIAEPLRLVLPMLLILSAASDLLTMTLPNRLVLTFVSVFPLLAYTAGLDLAEFGWHMLCGGGVLLICFGMFAAGWIGGGDAKLAAAIALCIGPEALLGWAVTASVFGGTLTMIIIAARSLPLPMFCARQEWLSRLHYHATGVPYGIALAAAGLTVYPSTAIFKGLAA